MLEFSDMKVLCSLLVLGVVHIVHASPWLKRDDSGESGCDSNACWKISKPMYNIYMSPSIRVILDENGILALDCSLNTLSKARQCKNDTVFVSCSGPIGSKNMFIAWDFFCENKGDMEDLAACWNNGDLDDSFSVCYNSWFEDSHFSVPDCIGNATAALPGCGDTAGGLLRELLSQLRT